jgi:CDP-diacylglycerol--serine O-phosphatidyltransferase
MSDFVAAEEPEPSDHAHAQAHDRERDLRRQHRRRRMRRHGRRAYIRSVYFLPSMATLGNAICGFGAMYVATLSGDSTDRITNYFLAHRFVAAAYLVFAAMIFDALDGRLARFARHTTDFGGQLDSLADVVSFGAAPAFVALQVFKSDAPADMPYAFTRLIWAISALYLSCAAIRLARFNVSNEHGEQHHFSFLGLPSPGAAGAVVALILMQQDLRLEAVDQSSRALAVLANTCVWILPLVVLACGLLMVSNIRYPHVINRYLRGRRSIARLLFMVALLLLFVVAHRYVLGIGTLAYVVWGATNGAIHYWRHRHPIPPPA